MPANQSDGPAHWTPRPDFVRSGWVSFHAEQAQPQTREAIRDYLVDIGASALALANQFVDPDAVDEIYDDMAMRVYEDVSADLLPLEIAILRQQYRELGLRRFSYVIRDGNGQEFIKAS